MVQTLPAHPRAVSARRTSERLRVAVVDDDPQDRDHLVSHLRRAEHECPMRFEVRTFTDGRDLVRRYRAEFDLILLDVQMQYLDEFETARLIRNLDPAVAIVFVTNMAAQATRGYEVDALHYLVKPVAYFPLSQVVARCVHRKRRPSGSAVLLPTQGGVARVPLADIVHVATAARHHIDVHALDRTHSFSGTIRALEQDLSPEAGFFRSNSCYLVNLAHVLELRPSSCIVTGGAELTVSRSRRRAFTEALTDAIARAR